MVSTFISPVIGRAAELGVSAYEDNELMELHENDSIEAVETVIMAVYRQVLGNAYVMESERLTIAESKLKKGDFSVREFVRQVAQSELYKSRFFDSCPRYRSIELNFKHLLGRAPDSYSETNAHSQILDRGGYTAEINSYIDSDEYQNKFGENIVPYYCGYKTQTGKNIVGFTHLFQLLRGASCSDKKLTTKDKPRLTNSLLKNKPSAIIPPSDAYSYGGVTDINKLLAKVLNPQKAIATSNDNSSSQATKNIGQYSSSTSNQSQSDSNLEQQFQKQQQQIEELQQKLNSLSSFASIGKFETNRWQSTGVSGVNITENRSNPQTSSVQNISQQNYYSQTTLQKQYIADLKQKIADAQRLANIGEARLNKWRSRTFF